MASMLQPGVLTLAATPIGNPLDASVRLMRALGSAELIAAEDTRRLTRLAADLEVEITARVVSYHEHNEAQRTGQLLEALGAGLRVLIVTDAGMPVVSDPGSRAVGAAPSAAYEVTVLPCPSAVLTALASSGIAPDRFTCEGFPPRRDGRRTSTLQPLVSEQRTMIFSESPRRTAATLASMAAAFGSGRSAAVARELTTTHEQVLRGSLGELADWAAATAGLGETVTVAAGGEAGTGLAG